MAAFHTRSKSFPSRSNPLVSQIEDQLRRVNSSKAASSSEIYGKLSSLQDLHDCIDKLLLLPQTHHTFSQDENKKTLGELNDASLKLLDLCSIAQDALVQAKESARELQSTLRRKTGIQETQFKKYLASRKVVKKVIKKAMESLKAMQKNNLDSSLLIQDQETFATVTILKNVEAVTLSGFESLFSLISGPKWQSRSHGWPLVSKLMHNKRGGRDGEDRKEGQFEKVDAALQSTNKSMNIQDELKDLDLCIQDLEESLESLYRHLVKTRVSFLNILNH